MDFSKVGIIGYRGTLGSRLTQYGCQGLDCDVTSIASIKNSIDGKNLETIINCSGYTNVDRAEHNIIPAYAINSLGPRNILETFKGRIIHFSTDFIFDGLSGPYSEDDQPNPIQIYGQSKYAGEQLISYRPNVLIIRTTILYDTNKKHNFVLSVYNQLLSGTSVRVPDSLFGNPTYVPHLVSGVIFCLENKIEGVLNLVDTTIVSRYELSKYIARVCNFDENLVQKGIAWGDAKRPQNLGLKTEKAEQLGVPLFDLWKGLLEFRDNERRNVISN
jgi:dTDP-4-dehydrorhamnose reductase